MLGVISSQINNINENLKQLEVILNQEGIIKKEDTNIMDARISINNISDRVKKYAKRNKQKAD